MMMCMKILGERREGGLCNWEGSNEVRDLQQSWENLNIL